MDVARLTKIAEWLETPVPTLRGMTFDMYDLLEVDHDSDPEHWCGTSCCIAGAAQAMFEPEFVTAQLQTYLLDLDTWDRASNLLGLNPNEAHHLFAP